MTYSPNFRGNSAKGASKATGSNYTSGSLVTMAKGTPVSVNAFSQIVPTDASDEASVHSMIGLVATSLPSAASGSVMSEGRLENVSTAFSYGDPVYLGKGGTLINTRPSIGVAGFISGDFVVFLGVVVKNEFNPAQKDIQLMRLIVGQL